MQHFAFTVSFLKIQAQCTFNSVPVRAFFMRFFVERIVKYLSHLLPLFMFTEDVESEDEGMKEHAKLTKLKDPTDKSTIECFFLRILCGSVVRK